MISRENMPSIEIRVPRKPYEELRQHHRLYVPIPLRYQLTLLESEESYQGEGTLKNISLGGVFFTCETPLPLVPGQLHIFSIATAASRDKLRQAYTMTARGMVVRVEQPAHNGDTCGIAVKFLSPLEPSPA